MFDMEVIVRRQNQEHCASITCMIRHYVARRAKVIEDHPHNAADRAICNLVAPQFAAETDWGQVPHRRCARSWSGGRAASNLGLARSCAPSQSAGCTGMGHAVTRGCVGRR